MSPVSFSETLTPTDECARRQNPEEHNRHPHRRKNFQVSKNDDDGFKYRCLKQKFPLLFVYSHIKYLFRNNATGTVI